MRYLLNVVYSLGLLLALPWLLLRAIRHGKYRDGWQEKLWGRIAIDRPRSDRIWLHAVSVGEVNLLEPLIQSLREQRPDCECVISTTTRTGYELARRKFPGFTVFYCPLDFSWSVAEAMRRVRPSLLVLAELEVWPNLIAEAARSGVPIAVANGRLSERSYRGYRRFRSLLRPTFARLNLVAAQTRDYADRFVDLGVPTEQVQVTGSIKFDQAVVDRNNPHTVRLAQLAGITRSDQIFLAGSTQAPEEQLALETLRSLSSKHPALRLILVPRHPERFDEVAALLEQSGLRWQRRSRLDSASSEAPSDGRSTWQVLLVDTIGELRGWWGTAQYAYVGGSMGSRGGQNMIEPAAYGAAVAFGPRTSNFRDVVALLLTNQAATVVSDGYELTRWLQICLDDPTFAANMGQRAQHLVDSQRGAAAATTASLLQILPRPTETATRAA